MAEKTALTLVESMAGLWVGLMVRSMVLLMAHPMVPPMEDSMVLHWEPQWGDS